MSLSERRARNQEQRKQLKTDFFLEGAKFLSDIELNPLEDAKNAENNAIYAFKGIPQGHRKQLFTPEQKREIFYKNFIDKIPKRELARQYHCSEGTIRNAIKWYLENG